MPLRGTTMDENCRLQFTIYIFRGGLIYAENNLMYAYHPVGRNSLSG